MISDKKLNITPPRIKPFLRWAGGKTWLIKHLEEFLPSKFENYHEPFIGGGSIFLFLKSNGYIKNKSFISDANKDLIETYKTIKSNPSELIAALKSFKNSETEYYSIRAKTFDNQIQNSAKFIYLNKTSFNGIYRVNKQGIYNVPYGHRKTKDLYDYDNILRISTLFKNTFFSTSDFKKSCQKARENDLVFLDPPYTVAHENNGFIQYNQSIFSWENQIELSHQIINLDDRKIKFILTNARHDSIDELYQRGKKQILSRASTIGGLGAERKSYNELIITNI